MSSEPPTSPPRTAAPRGGLLALAIALLALALGAFGAWQGWRLERTQAERDDGIAGAQASIAQRADDASREVAAAQRALEALTQKLADAEAVNRTLREEVLGLGERAKIVEDAVSSLAERRLGGSAALRLNEAEFLLRLGQERLVLFGDAGGTIAAFRLADAELSAMDDPVFAGVRQTIAAEIAALAADGAHDSAARLAALDRLAAAAATLPPRVSATDAAAPVAADAPWYARALHALGQFVRIRRVDPADAALINPLNVEAARSALQLELLLAKAALVVGDGGRYATALTRARERLRGSFADDDPGVRSGLEALDGAIAAIRTEPPPPVGNALDELRNLRTARALADPGPQPQATPEPEPEPELQPELETPTDTP